MASLKLYLYGAIALALIGAGIWIRGVFAERAALRVQVASLEGTIKTDETNIAGRDNVIASLKAITQTNNEVISALQADTAALVTARNAVQARLEASQEAYARLEVAHQTPLPEGCEAAVRAVATRAGAKP